jgi:hypothetical protein
VPLTRFADLHADIDDAGGKIFPRAIDHRPGFAAKLIPFVITGLPDNSLRNR